MVWHAVASILRDPMVLAGRLDARLRRLGASQIEARSEVEYLRGQFAELVAKEDRALALWLDSDLHEDAKSKVKARLSELASQRRAVADRLAAAEAAASSSLWRDLHRARQRRSRQLHRSPEYARAPKRPNVKSAASPRAHLPVVLPRHPRARPQTAPQIATIGPEHRRPAVPNPDKRRHDREVLPRTY
jgi:hypothetical protein